VSASAYGNKSLLTAAVNLPLSAFAAERRAAAPLLLSAGQQSIDISCPPGAQQQTRRTPLLWSNDGTDRRTGTRASHRPCFAYYAGSGNTAASVPVRER